MNRVLAGRVLAGRVLAGRVLAGRVLETLGGRARGRVARSGRVGSGGALG